MKPESFELSPEDRKHAEMQAAMVYYRDLIELKLRQGEEVNEDSELFKLLEQACDAFELHIS